MRVPKDPNVMDTLAWVYFKNRSYQRAINLLEDSIDINPRNPIYHYHLGMAQYENGFAREARKSLEKSLELKPNFADADTVRQILVAWDKKDKPKFDASRIETSNLEGDSFEMK
jgi:tetratricopeptide (TPR) repeat protein